MTHLWIDDERDASEEQPASSPPVVGLHTVPADRKPAEVADHVTALKRRLSSLPVIEQAKGALIITYGLTAEAASRCCSRTPRAGTSKSVTSPRD